jgi:hypothetical protein
MKRKKVDKKKFNIRISKPGPIRLIQLVFYRKPVKALSDEKHRVQQQLLPTITIFALGCTYLDTKYFTISNNKMGMAEWEYRKLIKIEYFNYTK